MMETKEIIEKIGKHWDDYSENFDSEHDTENKDVWKAFLEEILGPDKCKSVLDLGTGTGFLANMTAELGYPSIGLDISEKMMALGVEHAKEQEVNTVFMKGSALDLPFVDNTVDYIVNARLIWTLVEPETAMAEWARVLKPGGRAFCFNRMEENVGMTVFKADYYQNEAVDGALKIVGARNEELIALMENNGYKDVKIMKLPETAKNDEVRNAEWYQPWFVLCGTKTED